MEKQKAKYTYGILEKQFENLFKTPERQQIPENIKEQLIVELYSK
jgi:ribosomal protein S4